MPDDSLIKLFLTANNAEVKRMYIMGYDEAKAFSAITHYDEARAFAEQWEDGYEEGYAEGLAEVRAAMIKKFRAEERDEIISMLLESGISREEIRRRTGI